MKINHSKLSHSIEIKIPFYDVDTMNITWHGHYIKYFEQARCALLDKIGFNYQAMKQTEYAWPIVDFRIKYVKPSVFAQDIIVFAEIVEYENRLKINYLIKDKITDTVLTKACSIQVAVNKNNNKLNIISPEPLTAAIEEFLC